MNHEVEMIVEDSVQHLYGAGLPLPATPGAAALDLRSPDFITIQPRKTVMVNSRVKINMRNTSMCALLLPRSGLAIKSGVTLANSVGLIDSDYQGDLIIGLHNFTGASVFIKPGDRIVQLLFVPIIRPELKMVHEFSTRTKRGEGGLGSTGRE